MFKVINEVFLWLKILWFVDMMYHFCTYCIVVSDDKITTTIGCLTRLLLYKFILICLFILRFYVSQKGNVLNDQYWNTITSCIIIMYYVCLTTEILLRGEYLLWRFITFYTLERGSFEWVVKVSYPWWIKYR